MNNNEPTSESSSAATGAGRVVRGSGGGLNRRVLVKGAAWSVPAITVSAAAPAFAASCVEEVPGGNEVHATDTNLGNARAALSVPVPDGAGRMQFEVVGGSGGSNFTDGARIIGDLAVSPGQTYLLVAGAGGESYGRQGRGGKSLFGNGGNGGTGQNVRGSGGGGASTLLLGTTVAGATIVAVAGGGGGSHANVYPIPGSGSQAVAARFSGSLRQDTTATYNSSSVTAFGGNGNGGWSGSGMAGETGLLGWMGNRPDTDSAPTASQIRMMSGGGRGGGATAGSPGSGGGFSVGDP